MTMMTMYYAIDGSQPDENEHEQRLETCCAPTVGDIVWMSFNKMPDNWQVVATHLFTSGNSGLRFCLAEVAKTAVKERYLPTAINLYMLDEDLYTYSICGGQLSPPKLGPFEEYAPRWLPESADFDPIPCKRLPIDKHITSYERLTGNGAFTVYVVQLKLAPALVAA